MIYFTLEDQLWGTRSPLGYFANIYSRRELVASLGEPVSLKVREAKPGEETQYCGLMSFSDNGKFLSVIYQIGLDPEVKESRITDSESGATVVRLIVEEGEVQ